ncbi:MAG TPA: hypothetical protein VMV74_00250 [Bacteroidales bacterium]|nr:hypothetical protein [Bacteroidales bacterium]
MNYKRYMTVAVLMCSLITLSGQQITDSKTYMKSFRVGKSPTLDVSNKYGNIHITHAGSDSISVRVEVTASSGNESRLQGMMSDVEISITMTNQTVRAQTIFGKSVNALFETFKGLTKSIINYESRLQINYFIECPPSTKLRLTNSYGDVYIGEDTDELTLTLSNGSLDADVIKNALSMDLTFCKADIGSIEKGRISVSFGELRLKETEDLSLTARSSKIWIEKSTGIDIDSKRDVVNIGTAETITGTTYFSDLTADMLTRELSLVTKYGNLAFKNITGGFSLIDINSSYADVDLSLASGASYNLEVRHANAFVSLPGVSPQPEQTEISAENKIYLTTGKVGSSPDRARIRIEALKGEIRLLQK